MRRFVQGLELEWGGVPGVSPWWMMEARADGQHMRQQRSAGEVLVAAVDARETESACMCVWAGAEVEARWL